MFFWLILLCFWRLPFYRRKNIFIVVHCDNRKVKTERNRSSDWTKASHIFRFLKRSPNIKPIFCAGKPRLLWYGWRVAGVQPPDWLVKWPIIRVALVFCGYNLPNTGGGYKRLLNMADRFDFTKRFSDPFSSQIVNRFHYVSALELIAWRWIIFYSKIHLWF